MELKSGGGLALALALLVFIERTGGVVRDLRLGCVKNGGPMG
jgi:hypothetical protein